MIGQRLSSFCRVLAYAALASSIAVAQPSDAATIQRHGDTATLSVKTHRPVDAITKLLESKFGIAVGAEDPSLLFAGDWMDISREEPTVRTGTLVPARWGFDVRFPVRPDGSPRDVLGLLHSIAAAANARSPFAYRLDEAEAGGAFSFVPTRTRNPGGRSIAALPLLDRRVSIPSAIRPLAASASLMAEELSRQTGLRVSCCQSFVAGVPWGLPEVSFSAQDEPARSVLLRLGLTHWHVRCDRTFCVIDIR